MDMCRSLGCRFLSLTSHSKGQKVIAGFTTVVVVVAVTFSSLAKILGEGWTIHSLPALILFCFLSGDQLAYITSTF